MLETINPNSARTTSHMASEIREIPAVFARQLQEGMPLYRELAARLRCEPPRFAITCARGTSDHASLYFKYLLETRLGLPVASIGPSVASIYEQPLQLEQAICLTISQSGGSPDLAALQATAQQGGGHTIALLNVTDSPVAHAAQTVLPLLAGPELAVAATKSYAASLFAIACLVAEWTQDKDLLDALTRLPEVMESACEQDWSHAMLPIAHARSVYCIGRGMGLSSAAESALKFKETCRLHAEAYSSAEVRHGPIALADIRFAAIVFQSRDATGTSLASVAKTMRDMGAVVFNTDFNGAKQKNQLPVVSAPHLLLDPICQIASFYNFVEQLSRQLGFNPDAPANLSKVTQTQ